MGWCQKGGNYQGLLYDTHVNKVTNMFWGKFKNLRNSFCLVAPFFKKNYFLVLILKENYDEYLD